MIADQTTALPPAADAVVVTCRACRQPIPDPPDWILALARQRPANAGRLTNCPACRAAAASAPTVPPAGDTVLPSSTADDGSTSLPVLQDVQDFQGCTKPSPPSAIPPSAKDVRALKANFPGFVAEAIERANSAEAWQAFFRFVRDIRSYFPEGAVDAERAFRRTAEAVKPLGGWAACFPDSSDVDGAESAQTFFVHYWGRIRTRADEAPLLTAHNRAKAQPLISGRGTPQHPVPSYDRFVGLSGWLQVTAGDRPIMLPCDDVAAEMNSTNKMVTIWRAWAVEDKFLRQTAPHRFRSAGGSKATEFRFDVRRFPELLDAAPWAQGRNFEDDPPAAGKSPATSGT